MKSTPAQPFNLQRLFRRCRIRLACFIVRGKICQFEGRRKTGEWVKGDIITTPSGMKALKASFWAGAQVYSDTALEESDSEGSKVK